MMLSIHTLLNKIWETQFASAKGNKLWPWVTGTVVWDEWKFFASDDEMSVWLDDDYPNDPFRMLDYDSPSETEIVCMMARKVSSGKIMLKEGA